MLHLTHSYLLDIFEYPIKPCSLETILTPHYGQDDRQFVQQYYKIIEKL